MGNRLPRLVFDVDGVFADFTTGFLGLINEKFGTHFTREQWTRYCPIGDTVALGDQVFTKEQWDYGWEQLFKTPFFWEQLKPWDGIDFERLDLEMETLQYNGIFVTRRQDLDTLELGDSLALTRMFLENNGLCHYSGVIAQRQGDRVALLKQLEPDAYLEDWGDQFLEVCAAGINAYLIDRPWNRDITTPRRVHSVHEFVNRAIGRVRSERNTIVLPLLASVPEAVI